MKFKDLDYRGMTIHCDTQEKAKALLEHLEGKGYDWLFNLSSNYWNVHGQNTCYFITKEGEILYDSIIYARKYGQTITEFDDLLEPENSIVASIYENYEEVYNHDGVVMLRLKKEVKE